MILTQRQSRLSYGSLFSGIGGFDLGFDRAGLQCKWQVELDEFANRVLAKHWPHVQRFRDVRQCGRDNLATVDVICGGFPCQPHSVAGKRRGADDDRWLWPDFARIVCELKPKWVVVENVRGLLSVNAGREFGTILADLAHIGYDAEWEMLRASDVGAIHGRDRVFIVAYDWSKRIPRLFAQQIQRQPAFSWCQDVRRVEDLRGRSDIPEPLVRRTRNGIPYYMDRVRCLGNAVIPQLAEWIGRKIVEIESTSEDGEAQEIP